MAAVPGTLAGLLWGWFLEGEGVSFLRFWVGDPGEERCAAEEDCMRAAVGEQRPVARVVRETYCTLGGSLGGTGRNRQAGISRDT